MKALYILFILFIAIQVSAQIRKPEDFGFRHLQILYKGDTVDMLIKSKKGDELKAKPLFFFCQGSQPQPLIKTDGEKTYGVFPFKEDSITEEYHLVIVSKPYIPLVVDVHVLGNNFNYLDSKTGLPPKNYSDRNLLDYYVNRDIEVIRFLQKQVYISQQKLVIAGHSEGSTIAAKIALLFNRVTHLIYSSGCPFGRIMAMVGRDRVLESDTDSTRYTEDEFKYWEKVVNDPANMDDSEGDTNKASFDFSVPPIQYLQQLKIPVLISYGTKDWGAVSSNDYLHIEMTRQKKKNFTFNAYIGLEHNFFPLKANGEPDYNMFNWDMVALDWKKWLDKK